MVPFEGHIFCDCKNFVKVVFGSIATIASAKDPINIEQEHNYIATHVQRTQKRR
jgi:hypothetical protein